MNNSENQKGFKFLIQNSLEKDAQVINSQNQSKLGHFFENRGFIQSKLSHIDAQVINNAQNRSFFKMDNTQLASRTNRHQTVAKSARQFSASRKSGGNMFQKAAQQMLPKNDVVQQSGLTQTIKNPPQPSNLRTTSTEFKPQPESYNIEPNKTNLAERKQSMQPTGMSTQNNQISQPPHANLNQQQRLNMHHQILQAPSKKQSQPCVQGVSGTSMAQNEKIAMINNSVGNFKSSSQGQQLNYNFQNVLPNTQYKQGIRNASMSSNGQNTLQQAGQNRQQLANLNSNFGSNPSQNATNIITNLKASNSIVNAHGQMMVGNPGERKTAQQASNSMPPRPNGNLLSNNQIVPSHLLVSNTNLALKQGNASNNLQVSQPAFMNQSNAHQNQNTINTLLQNRKDGQLPGSSNRMAKAPSGKDLMNQQKLNFQNGQTISKSVEKPQSTVQGSAQANQYIQLNSKDGKNNQMVANAGFKEKRLSQSQAQQFVNSQFTSQQQTILPNVQNPSQITPIGLNSGTQIIIHVCDENKKMNKDFKCDKNLLISNMKYFEKYLSDSKTLDDIDISVHCDINIFDWLMRYIHRKEPVIEIKNSVSILISSDFLQMAGLVEEALGYVAKNLNEIIQLPIDMNCMNSILIKRLAAKISLNDLNELSDKKDKLTSKLYMKKLECLFEEEHNMLHRCVNCSSLYTSNQREWIQCPKANIFIDFNGNLVAKHQSDKHWDINKFVMFLRQKNLAWQDIFWKMFARLQEFKCTNCDNKFIGAEINHCSTHPITAKFTYQAVEGVHPCCDSKATRFRCGLKTQGCTARHHKIKTGSPRKTVKTRAQNFELLQDHFKVACEPFQYEREDPRTGEIEKKVQYGDEIEQDKALLHLVNCFIKQSPKHIAEQEAKAAKEAKREARQKQQELLAEKQLMKNAAAAMANTEDGLPQENNQNQITNSNPEPCLMESDSWEDLHTSTNGKDNKDEFDLNDEIFQMQDIGSYNLFKIKSKKGRRYREWKIDVIRNDDENQMQFLEKQLQRMRKKEEHPVSRKNQPKKSTQGCPSVCETSTNQQNVAQGRPATSSNMNYMSQGVINSQSMGMNIRNRVKQQQQQQRLKPNAKYNNNIARN